MASLCYDDFKEDHTLKKKSIADLLAKIRFHASNKYVARMQTGKNMPDDNSCMF